jgi:hypothetical protein
MGFQTEDEVRRRSSIAISSPQIRALEKLSMVVDEV